MTELEEYKQIYDEAAKKLNIANHLISQIRDLVCADDLKDRPRVVCLCGSTRFTKEMLVIQWELTKQGKIVLSWCALPNGYFEGTDHGAEEEGYRKIVDELHKRKIDLADEILVLNVGGYIGDSTRSEIDYARQQGKVIRWLEPCASSI